MARITPNALAAGRQAGLDLQQLKPTQLERLDTNDDGFVHDNEARAALELADLNKDGFLQPKELDTVKQLLGQERPGQGLAADFGKDGFFENAKAVSQQADDSVRQARARFDEASTGLGRQQLPTRTAAELRAERATVANPAPMRQQAAAKTKVAEGAEARHAQVSKELAAAEKLLGAKDAAQVEPSIAMFSKELERTETMLDIIPDQKLKEGLVVQLKQEVGSARGLHQNLNRRYGPSHSSTQQARAELDTLEKRLAQVETFDPARAKESAKRLRESLAPKLERAKQLETAQATATRARAELPQLAATASSARRDAAALQQQAATHEQRGALLERQERFASAREGLTRAESEAQPFARLVSDAQAGAGEISRDKQILAQAKPLMAAGQEALGAVANDAYLRRRTAALVQVRELADRGELKGKQINRPKLDADIAMFTRAIERNQAGAERAGANLVKKLEDPRFQQALMRLPADERGKVVGDMLAIASQTQAGAALFDQQIAPVLEGEGKGTEFWKSVLLPPVDTTNGRSHLAVDAEKARKGVNGTMAVLAGVGGQIAARTGASKDFLDKALQASLALNPDELATVKQAVIQHAHGKGALAEQTLRQSNLGRLAGALNGISGTVTGISSVIALGEVMRNPTLVNGIEAGRGTAQLVELSGKLASEGSKWAKFAHAAGKVAPVADIVLGHIEKNRAADRGDVGGTVGQAMVEGGGAMALTGLALDATGIGATIGVPMNIAGTVVAIAGAVVDKIWGDSSTEKFLKSQSMNEYIK